MSSSLEATTARSRGLVVRKLRDRFDVIVVAGDASPADPGEGSSPPLVDSSHQGEAEGPETGPAPPRPVGCGLSGAARRGGFEAIAVGDHVEIARESGSLWITRALPRRNGFRRRAAGRRPTEQWIAANLDWVVPVVSMAEPSPRWRFLDRCLVQAEADGLPGLIIAAKVDLALPVGESDRLEVYRRAGYPVILTSALDGRGLEELSALLRGRTAVLVGGSGVGKSSLINRLLGVPLRRTGAVNQVTGKGRHTTSDVCLFPLPGGGALIDTPGLREFGLWEVSPSQTAAFFPEMRPHLEGCRFGPRCTHAHEPECAVREAVASGLIDPERYRSFLRLAGLRAIDPPVKRTAGRQRSFPDSRTRRPDEPRPGRPQETFRCLRCGQEVSNRGAGSAHRNHCPICLWSRHLDHRPGDRAAGCGGAMEPVAVAIRSDGEWSLVHQCQSCGTTRINRIAGDDNGPLLLSLAARPLARPPFPLDRLEAGR